MQQTYSKLADELPANCVISGVKLCQMSVGLDQCRRWRVLRTACPVSTGFPCLFAGGSILLFSTVGSKK